MKVENIGVHCSAGGGYVYLFETIKKLQLDTFQIFTKNHRQWKEKLISDDESAFFKANFLKNKVKTGISHTTYLINLASADDEIRRKSIIALAAEIERCKALGIKYAVLHPGGSKLLSDKQVIDRIAQGLKVVIDYCEGNDVMILLENTAGQGASIGWKFENLREIIESTECNNIGVCFDTCHAFAAGYDIRTTEGFNDVMNQFDKKIGLKFLKAFHLNDSKGDFKSRIDRHEHLGKGKIGITPFVEILKNFPGLPKVIETDHEGGLHIKDLELLRSF